MSSYRLYCIRNGSFFDYDEFFADNDQEAVTKSMVLRKIGPSELWSRSRQVHSFDREGLVDAT